MQQEKSRPLPKFGEWDVNYPASADGFTVIFAKARDDKKSNGTAATMAAPPPQRNDHPQRQEQKHQHPIEVHQYLQTLLNHAALMVSLGFILKNIYGSMPICSFCRGRSGFAVVETQLLLRRARDREWRCDKKRGER